MKLRLNANNDSFRVMYYLKTIRLKDLARINPQLYLWTKAVKIYPGYGEE